MAAMTLGRNSRKLAVGLAFLLPNILGFAAFTLFPLIYSMTLAFSNWDLRLHNMFREEAIRFVGFANFHRLLSHPDFWLYFGNTLFLMMAIPLSIAGSLVAALLLNNDLGGKKRGDFRWIIAGAVLVASLLLLVALGMGATTLPILLCGIAGLVLIGGVVGRNTVYRTLFYTPHFTAGVATFILWKKLYNPQTGPINLVLAPVLDTTAQVVNALPGWTGLLLLWLLAAAVLGVLHLGLGTLRRLHAEGELNGLSLVLPIGFLLIPPLCALRWIDERTVALSIAAAAAGLLLLHLTLRLRMPSESHAAASGKGGTALLLAIGLMTVQFSLIGLGEVFFHLPAMAADGLNPPGWIAEYHWAKPSLMIMGLWAAIGSNNMILYLAGLSTIPGELYEASSIDGAGKFQTFWHITWPQLAPVTFFIFVMSIISGLQGGFEMARTMTQGGPAGATTTLSYFVYTEGFVTGQLGYASAVAWTLFALVFSVTLFNWKFGNRFINE